MKKAILFAIPALLLAFTGCKKAAKKAEEIKQEIINGYWKAADGVVVEISDDQAVVVDFGTSNLGTNTSVFKVGDVFIKNIERIGPNNWNAEVIIPSFNANDEVTSITFVPTSIITEASGSTRILNIENATAAYQSWNAYTNPGSGNNNGGVGNCDTTSIIVVDTGNYLKWNTNEFYGTKVRCGYRKSSGKCVYYFWTQDLYGGGHKVELTFGEKPQVGKTYNIVTGVGAVPDNGVKVAIDAGNYFEGNVIVTADNGKLKAEATNLVSGSNTFSFVIYGN